MEGATELEFTGSEALAGGFQIRLVSRDKELLRQASAEIRDFLTSLEDVSNIRDAMASA